MAFFNVMNRRALLAAASASTLGLAISGALYSPAAAQDAGAEIGQVVVTASRIQSAGFTAPTPTSVLSTTEVQRRAPVALQETINDLPAFRPSTTPQNSSSPTNGANSGAGTSTIDLRGLGTTRTLLLVDGHRTGASQDLNQFPTILTQRIDVVTGGASADYGSDAVAGVVNIILDTKFNGIKGDIQYGQTKYGDDQTGAGSLAIGHEFLGGRAHLLIGGDYMLESGARTADPITSDPRPWIAANRGLQIANPCPVGAAISAACPTGGNGYLSFVDTDQENFSTMNAGGLITAGPLKGTTFDANGVPRQFQYGVVMGNNQIGGEGTNPSIFNLRPFESRYAALAHLDYKFTDHINGWLELANSRNDAKVLAVRPRDQANLSIKADNAFIPASIKAQVPASGLTMGRFNNDGGQPESEVIANTYRYQAGLDGDFNVLGKAWTWDASVQYGRAVTTALTKGSRITANWLLAIDAVTVTAANVGASGLAVGSVACRSTLAAPANGCKPFNIFGSNVVSQAAKDYVFANQANTNVRAQTNASFNLHGEPFSTWAGPVAMAAGAEYRKEELNVTSDPIAQAAGWDSGNTKALSGSFNVAEGYLEVAVPLAKDMVFAKSLDFNGAVRYANYNLAGGVTTYKMGGTWEPIAEVLLRGTYSRDIRAPAITELFTSGGQSQNNVVQFQGPKTGQSTLINFITQGNINLKPEQADTYTFGATWRPKFARLRLSADYFSITINGVIQTVIGQTAVDQCKIGNQSFCALLTWDTPDGKQAPNASITAVSNRFVNNASQTTRGIDLEASYVQPLRDLPMGLSLPGQLTFRAFATEVLEFSTTDQTGKTDRSGQDATTIAGTIGVPRWVANYAFTYDLGQFSTTANFRFISPGVIEPTSPPGTRQYNNVPGQTITNFAASYNLINSTGRKLQVYGAVNNAFNQGTPFPVFALTQNGYGYDNLGTVWRGGIRFNY